VSAAREDAQRGKSLIKQAILELLAAQNGNGLSRSTIEDLLGIGPDYKASGVKGYEGGLAAMLLSELVESGRILRNKTGKGWLYGIPESTIAEW
jgi:hypothetical protein